MLRESALLLLLLAGCSRAQYLVPYGHVVEVNKAEGAQAGAAIAALASGGFVVAYEHVNAMELFACVYDIGGALVVPEFQLNGFTAGGDGTVKVSGLADGGFVAVWRRGGKSTDLVGRTFTEKGTGVSGEFVVTQAAQQTPDHQVVGLVGGNIAVTWSEEGVGVLCNVYEPSGQALHAKPVTIRSAAGNADMDFLRNQGLTATDDGGFAAISFLARKKFDRSSGLNIEASFAIVLYTGTVDFVESLPQSPHTWHSVAQNKVDRTWHDMVYYESAITSLATGFAIATRLSRFGQFGYSVYSTRGKVWKTHMVYQQYEQYFRAPAMSRFAGGGFLLTWRDEIAPDTFVVKGQVYDESGRKHGTQDPLLGGPIDQSGSNKYATSCILVGDERVVVSYRSGQVVYNQVYTRTVTLYPTLPSVGQGNPLVRAGEQVEVVATGDAKVGAVVAALASGGFVVAYDLVYAMAVVACVYGRDGGLMVYAFQLNTLEEASVRGTVKVSGLADGGFVAVWRRGGNDSTEIVGRTFTDMGVSTSGEFVVTQAAQQQTPGQVVGLVGGNFAVAWTEQGVGALCNVYEPSGQALHAKPVVLQPWSLAGSTGFTGTTTALQVDGLAALGTGGFAVAAGTMTFYPRGASTVRDFMCDDMVYSLTLFTSEAALVKRAYEHSPYGCRSTVSPWTLTLGPILVSSGRNGFVIGGPLVATATYSNNGTRMSDGLGLPAYTLAEQLQMFPSGAVLSTRPMNHNDGFGLNKTTTLRGEISVGAASLTDYHVIGGITVLFVSNGTTLLHDFTQDPIVDTAILSDRRVVVVGDTNSHGKEHVNFIIYDVLGISTDTAAPDTEVQSPWSATQTAAASTVTATQTATTATATATVPTAALTRVPLPTAPSVAPLTARPAWRETPWPDTPRPGSPRPTPAPSSAPAAVPVRGAGSGDGNAFSTVGIILIVLAGTSLVVSVGVGVAVCRARRPTHHTIRSLPGSTTSLQAPSFSKELRQVAGDGTTSMSAL